jgi:hypothetical protein
MVTVSRIQATSPIARCNREKSAYNYFEMAEIVHGRETPVIVSHEPHVSSFTSKLSQLYQATLSAGDDAAAYWADVAVHSKSPLAGLANIPGVLATVWTHDSMTDLQKGYRASTQAGVQSTQYWADVSVKSKSPLAPLACIPGAFAALWTPETAPSTALTLGSAMYTFGGLPAKLTHFTTEAGAAGIASDGAVLASRGAFAGIPRLGGLFGPGVYMARLGPPLNLFIRAAARIPIVLETPAGTARIIPYLVYIRWGTAPLLVP